MRQEVEKEYDRIVDYYSKSIGMTVEDEPFLALITMGGRVFGRTFIKLMGIDEDNQLEKMMVTSMDMGGYIEAVIRGIIDKLESDEDVHPNHRISGVIIAVLAQNKISEKNFLRIESYDRDGDFWVTMCPIKLTGTDKEYIIKDVEPVVIGVNEEYGSVFENGLWPWQ